MSEWTPEMLVAELRAGGDDASCYRAALAAADWIERWQPVIGAARKLRDFVIYNDSYNPNIEGEALSVVAAVRAAEAREVPRG